MEANPPLEESFAFLDHVEFLLLCRMALFVSLVQLGAH